MPLTKSFTIIFFLVIYQSQILANAGTLDDFESAKSTPQSSNSSNSSDQGGHHDDDSDGLGNFIFELMMRSLWYASISGGETSTKRYVSSSENTDDIKPRKIGEPLIPEYRFDFHYQNANANITSTDYRFEYGEGKFGIQLRTTSLRENSNDQLRLNQLHALYRMSFGNHFGINYGIGVAQLIGNSRQTDLSLTFPVYFHPTDYLGLEIKTGLHFFQNAAILDLDYSVIVTKNIYSISFGYRELVKTGVDITGPYVGFSLHY